MRKNLTEQSKDLVILLIDNKLKAKSLKYTDDKDNEDVALTMPIPCI